jgi:hypothetical protein
VQVPRCYWCQGYAQISAINKFSELSPKPASINLQKWFLSPTGPLNLGFILRENLLPCSSYLPLGVPNWAASTATNQAFFWRHCRGERGFLQGESLASNIFTLLLFCLLSLIYICLHLFIKNTKKLVPL